MKNTVTGIILLLSVGIAAYMFSVKHDWSDADTDKFKTGLSGAAKYLPPGSEVLVKCTIPDSTRYIYFATYAIAPAIMKPRASGKDTILFLQAINNTDSATEALLKSSTVIWQHQDDHYSYKLAYRP